MRYKVQPSKMYKCPLGECYGSDMKDAASHFHGGQWSALYEFSSSGESTDLEGLVSEVEEALESDAGGEDELYLSCLLNWATQQLKAETVALLRALAKAGVRVVNGSVKFSDVDKVLEVLALDKAVSLRLTQDLQSAADTQARQKLLEQFVKDNGLAGDDLSDLMYDLERAGFHNLKKPQSASPTKPTQKSDAPRSGSPYEKWLDPSAPGTETRVIQAISRIISGGFDKQLGSLLEELKDDGVLQRVADFLTAFPGLYGKLIDKAEDNEIGFYENDFVRALGDKAPPITPGVIAHVSNGYVINSILHASVYAGADKRIAKDAIEPAWVKLGNPLKAYLDEYNDAYIVGSLINHAWGELPQDKMKKWFAALPVPDQVEIKKQWSSEKWTKQI